MTWVTLEDGTVVWQGEEEEESDPGIGDTKEGGSSGGSGSSKGMTKEERENLLKQLKLNYRQLFPGKKFPPMPGGLVRDALKYEYTDATSILDYLRKNARSQFQKTSFALRRAREVSENIDQIFGEKFKWKKAFIESYVMADSRFYDWDTYLEKVVVKSKAFRTYYAGWSTFYKSQGIKGMSYAQAIATYQQRRNHFLEVYASIMGSGKFTLDKDMLTRAITESWTDDTFTTNVKQYDPNYYNPENATTGSYGAGAKDRESEIKNLWHTIYGADSEPPDDIVERYVRGSETIEKFFNSTIRTSEEFRNANPWFEDWAMGQYNPGAGEEETEGGAATGHAGRGPGSGATTFDVNPFDFFKELNEWKQYYETLTEKPGVYNMDLIRKAMAGRWSNARFELEFKKTDPAYSGTAAATNKRDSFTQYWRSLFGSDAVPDAEIMDEYLRGNAENPESMFDQIRQTDLFREQYANWDVFAEAQSGRGYGADIISNPQVYKQYEAGFKQAFEEVGLDWDETWKRMFFESGIDDSTLNQNLGEWMATKTSYQAMTGNQANVAVASGITGTQPGADLRRRMEKALQTHRSLAQSKFNQYDINKREDNTLIRSI